MPVFEIILDPLAVPWDPSNLDDQMGSGGSAIIGSKVIGSMVVITPWTLKGKGAEICVCFLYYYFFLAKRRGVKELGFSIFFP